MAKQYDLHFIEEFKIMMEPIAKSIHSNLSPELSSALSRLRKEQLAAHDWQTEKLNYVPLRGSWFANSEADFDLEDRDQ